MVEDRAHNGGYEEHAHNHQCKPHVCKEEGRQIKDNGFMTDISTVLT